MKKECINFWGYTRWWWVILIVGIMMTIAGFAYWVYPIIGYEVVSMLFGWMMIIAGVVYLTASFSINRPKGWGWWLVGGILNIFLGFILVRSVLLSAMVLPFVFAILFFYWGMNALIGAIMTWKRRYWWINLINGILLLVISYFFVESGFFQDVMMISLLTSVAFIYWVFSIMIIANDMRPEK